MEKKSRMNKLLCAVALSLVALQLCLASNVAPTFVNQYNFDNQVFGVFVQGDYLFAGLPTKLVLVSMSKNVTLDTVPGNSYQGFAYDSNRNVYYVSDSSYDIIKVFAIVENKLMLQKQFGANILNHPLGLAFDNNGHLFVSDCGNDRVVVFDTSNGELVTIIPAMEKPHGIALNSANGNLFVVEQYADRVSVFDVSNVAVPQLIGNLTMGEPNKALSFPVGIAVSAAEDKVYVVDTDNQRICVFSARTREFLFTFDTLGAKFQTPYSVATVDSQVFVADVNNHRVAVAMQS